MTAPLLDTGLSLALRAGSHLPFTGLENHWLAPSRGAAVQRITEQLAPAVSSLEPALVSREPTAMDDYDALLTRALGVLRGLEPGGALGALGALDRGTLLEREEYCDDPRCPEPDRRRILACIDWLNEKLDSYRRWSDLLEGDLRPVAGRQTRLLDLAAGHAGFALALKERFTSAVDVTASDLFDEYLAMGREQAYRRGLDVRFLRQDATDLSNLREEKFDIVVCTQSIHHFPPGMVGRMLGEAARIARRSVWFIDAERSLIAAAMLGAVVGIHGRAWPPVHDTIVSLRKMYVEEELSLIGRLAPALPVGASVTTGRVAPGFAYVRVGLAKTGS